MTYKSHQQEYPLPGLARDWLRPVYYMLYIISKWKSRRYAIEISVSIFDDIIYRGGCGFFAQALPSRATSLSATTSFNHFLVYIFPFHYYYFFSSSKTYSQSARTVNLTWPSLQYDRESDCRPGVNNSSNTQYHNSAVVFSHMVRVT
jgi:hypothetical protein